MEEEHNFQKNLDYSTLLINEKYNTEAKAEKFIDASIGGTH